LFGEYDGKMIATLKRRFLRVLDSKHWVRKQGFEGDEYLAEAIEWLLLKSKIKTVIETGTKRAATTARFATLACRVITIEHNINLRGEIEKRLRDLTNVIVHYGDSAEVLRDRVLPGESEPVLFYLDAHTGPEINTLRRELEVIGNFPAGAKSVFVIHDMEVPEKSFGHNNYKYEDVVDLLKRINPEHFYFYNQRVDGLKRGVLFVGPPQIMRDFEQEYLVRPAGSFE
jgi:hypothetical protein